jgi:hypothetical protein
MYAFFEENRFSPVIHCVLAKALKYPSGAVDFLCPMVITTCHGSYYWIGRVGGESRI